jgi:hypothetical protein
MFSYTIIYGPPVRVGVGTIHYRMVGVLHQAATGALKGPPAVPFSPLDRAIHLPRAELCDRFTISRVADHPESFGIRIPGWVPHGVDRGVKESRGPPAHNPLRILEGGDLW